MDSLESDQFRIEEGQSWAVIGGNGSGKGAFSQQIARSSSLAVQILSFESQQAFYEKQLRDDDSEFMGRLDAGPTVFEMLATAGASAHQIENWARIFEMQPLLNRGYRLLSSGEGRKALLLAAIAKQPDLLILDEPFEGLDAQSYQETNSFCQHFVNNGLAILLLVNRLADIQEWNTHLAVLRHSHVVASGPKDQIMSRPEFRQLFKFSSESFPPLPPRLEATVEDRSDPPLLKLTNGRVSHQETVLFHQFDWELQRGHHTLITGPNGSGKSTLLQLISGDHPQCYTNELRIFGYQRGTGETIWDIKRHLGIISADLHRNYRAPGDAATTIVSGIYDSIGLYRTPQASERAAAFDWLDRIGLLDKAATSFRNLSYGEQRLVLIARALVKQPALVILDEPTQGLDDFNRHLVLSFIEQLGQQRNATLLFVSHRKDEWLSTFKHRLDFVPTPNGSALHKIELTKMPSRERDGMTLK